MRDDKEFYGFYDGVLRREFGALEAQRKEAQQRIYKVLAPWSISVGLLSLWAGRFESDAWYWILFCGVIIGIAIYRVIIEDYVKNFKANVIKKIIGFIDINLRYEAKNFVSKDEFIESSIFALRPNSYDGEDGVLGMIGDTPLIFSEVNAYYQMRRSTREIFKGLFFCAEFNKNFNTRTVILPDRAEKLFGEVGSFFQSFNRSKGELIKLENPEFERLFVVYGEDQIEARYILSPNLMERIVRFREKTGRRMYMSFVNSKVYMAVSYEKNLFEPRVFRPVQDYECIQGYFEVLSLFIGIVEALQLNRRIWGK